MTATDRRIVAAQGYLELGLHDEARKQLAALPTDATERADVMEMQVLCCMGERRWEEGLELAMKLCRLEKDEPGGFIHAAYCLHELGRTLEALQALRSGPLSLKTKAVYYYNVGCYTAKLGRMEEAVAMLEVAFQKKPELLSAALKDPDLAALRELLPTLNQ